MRIHRIFTDQALVTGSTVALAATTTHYLTRVLRVTAGQRIILFNGDGTDYAAEVGPARRGNLELMVQSRMPARPESPLHLTLVQAISRGERMDTSIRKATELGVSAIDPVFSMRSEVRWPAEKLGHRMEHWRKVMIAACEQSGRACLPDLRPPLDLLVWARQPVDAARLVLVPAAAESLVQNVSGRSTELLVGPEGGFDRQELEQLESLGVKPVSLGPRILRTETAGPAAVAIMQAIAGDFRC